MASDFSIPNPPIFRLNEDLLWSIFHLNADIFSDHHSLKTTQLTSHVCRAWRDLMLAAPSLWGRLIDLDALSNVADDWRHELLRRSGSALLRLKAGRIMTESSPLLLLLLDIVLKHWPRIERFDVYISLGAFEANLSNWNQLYLPAPHLQSFNLQICAHGGDQQIQGAVNIWSTSKCLFDNNAPRLREFHATWYNFTSQTKWITGLTSLAIGYPFKLEEVLFVLQNTPNIREISIGSLGGSMSNISRSLPLAHLPKLERCILQHDFRSCIALLQHLNLPSDCTLVFHPLELDGVSNTKEWEDFLKASYKLLSNLALRHLQCRKSRMEQLSLFISSNSFLLLYHGSSADDIPELSILSRVKARFPPYLPSFIFSEFAFPEFSQVTNLAINLNDSNPPEALTTFLSHFSSVKRLTTSAEGTFVHLCDLYCNLEERCDPTTILPNLDTIALKVSFRYQPLPGISSFSKDGHLHELLKFRRKNECPIMVLDLTGCRLGQFIPCFDYLEEMAGLRILWTERGDNDKRVLEYECGSGHPEKLPYPRPPAENY